MEFQEQSNLAQDFDNQARFAAELGFAPSSDAPPTRVLAPGKTASTEVGPDGERGEPALDGGSLRSTEVPERFAGVSVAAAHPRPASRIVQITTREQIVRLAGIGREYHGESRYAHVAFSEAKFMRAYERLITRPQTNFGVYVERGDDILGVMGAEIGEYYLGTDIKIATNYFLYVSGRVRGTALGGRVAVRLMRLFIDWAKAKGADEFNVHITSGIDPQRTDRFLKRLGLEAYGGYYAGRLG